tara:strand:+ start:661 stop:1488 length:828 start_codon:yes stop_codon:yes gene_type:complete
MPNRLLKSGICTSDTINLLTSGGEVFFYRLLVVADDLGNMDGREKILKANCFPLKDNITAKQIKSWVFELESAKLIVRYESEDKKQYLSILKWDQRVRSHGKYPLPSDSNLLTSDSNMPLGVGVGVGVGEGKGKNTTPLALLCEYSVSKQTSSDWVSLRNKLKAPVTKTVLEIIKRESDKAHISVEDALKLCIENSWRGFKAEWLLKTVTGDSSPQLNRHSIVTRSGKKIYDWRTSEEGQLAMGEKLGLLPLIGEHFKDHKKRIFEKLKRESVNV